MVTSCGTHRFPDNKMAVKTFDLLQSIPSGATVTIQLNIGKGWTAAIINMANGGGQHQYTAVKLFATKRSKDDGYGNWNKKKIYVWKKYEEAGSYRATSYQWCGKSYLLDSSQLTDLFQGPILRFFRIDSAQIVGENLEIVVRNNLFVAQNASYHIVVYLTNAEQDHD